jgi:hypothetical protein
MDDDLVDEIIESDFIRWLIRCPEFDNLLHIALKNIKISDLKNYYCSYFYELIIINRALNNKFTLCWLANELTTEGEREFLKILLIKKLNLEKREECFNGAILRILERKKQQTLYGLRQLIQSPNTCDKECIEILRQYENCKNKKIIIQE